MTTTNTTETDMLHRQVSALKTALVDARAEIIAAVHLRDPAWAPLIRGHLAAEVDEAGRVNVAVVDKDGRKRTEFDSISHKFRAVPAETLVGELLERHPALKTVVDQTAEAAPKKSAAPDRDAELLAKLRAEHDITPVWTAADDRRARSANPWEKAHFNLTEQMRVEKHGPPGLADELKRAAGAQ